MQRLAFALLVAALALTLHAGDRTVLAGPAPAPYELIILPSLGGDSSRTADINGANQICGTSERVDGNSVACQWTNEIPLDLGTLGGPSSSSAANNNFGQVCGNSPVAGVATGFCWTPNAANGIVGVMTPLPPLAPGKVTIAVDINSSGDICGTAEDAAGKRQACVWTPSRPNGTSFTIHPLGLGPGSANSFGTAINDNRTVAGTNAATPPSIATWTYANNQWVSKTHPLPAGSSQAFVSALTPDDMVVVNAAGSDPKQTTSKPYKLNPANSSYAPYSTHGVLDNVFDERNGTAVGSTQANESSPSIATVISAGAPEPTLLEGENGNQLNRATALNEEGNLVVDGTFPSGDRFAAVAFFRANFKLTKRAYLGSKELEDGVSVLVKGERVRYEITVTNRSGIALDLNVDDRWGNKAPLKLLEAATDPPVPWSTEPPLPETTRVSATFPNVGPGQSARLIVYCQVTRVEDAALVRNMAGSGGGSLSAAFAINLSKNRDATEDVNILLSPSTQATAQTVTIQNKLTDGNGSQIARRDRIVEGTIPGPMYLVLDNLQNATLRRPAGVTEELAPLGSPYLKLKAKKLPAGQKTTVRLKLLPDADGGPITFTPRFVIGTGHP